MAVFVLVHGAWGGAHGFRKVRGPLREAGHEVFTPSLTGIGERSHLTEERGGIHGTRRSKQRPEHSCAEQPQRRAAAALNREQKQAEHPGHVARRAFHGAALEANLFPYCAAIASIHHHSIGHGRVLRMAP